MAAKTAKKKPAINVSFSESTLAAMQPVKATHAEKICQDLIADNPTLAERFLKEAKFSGQSEFLTADLLGCATKKELFDWAKACGIEGVSPRDSKDKLIETMIADPKLELPKTLANLRPRI